MKLIACCKIDHGGVRLVSGDAFEASAYSGAKLIAQGAAKAAPRATKKRAEAQAEKD